jgi:predicted RNA-binding Zn ribbon-like protein
LIAGVAAAAPQGYRDGVDDGFQPAGRAPAPAPLALVQDFVNTEIPEWARDDIGTPALLEAWLQARSLLGPDEGVDAAGFVAARSLRTALRDLALLNTLRQAPGPEQRLALDGLLAPVALVPAVDPHGRLAVTGAGAGVARALGVLVAVVLDAQAEGTWARLKACRKDTCRWLFYDGSRNRSSNWCSMSICGNRTKTAAYRRRRQGRR